MNFYKASFWLRGSNTSLLILAMSTDEARKKLTNKLEKNAEINNDVTLKGYLSGANPKQKTDFSVIVSEEPLDLRVSNGIFPIVSYSSEFEI